MGQNKYNVLIGQTVVGKEMTLDNAIIFLKGLFNEYHNDVNLAITIEVFYEEPTTVQEGD